MRCCDWATNTSTAWQRRAVSLICTTARAMAAVEVDRTAKRLATVKALDSCGGSPSPKIVSRQFALTYLDEVGFAGAVNLQRLENNALIQGSLTDVALALGAYRTEHGRYPDELARLCPTTSPDCRKTPSAMADSVTTVLTMVTFCTASARTDATTVAAAPQSGLSETTNPC